MFLYLPILAISFLTYLSNLIIIKFANNRKIFDIPSFRKKHINLIPRLRFFNIFINNNFYNFFILFGQEYFSESF